jgi:hypothetical protein
LRAASIVLFGAWRKRCCCCNAAVAAAPFPLEMQQEPLYIARGDITAGETKSVKEATSVTARLEVSGKFFMMFVR